MDNTSFDDIRAYRDDEIPAAVQRIADDPLLAPAVRFAFPGMDIEAVRAAIRSCRTTEQIQRKIMYPVIKRILDSSVAGLDSCGTENVTPEGGQLFISNHRDIVLDAFLLQFVLFTHSLPTTDIALGDNLLHPQLVADIFRVNHMVKVIRKDDIPPREFLENSRHLTEYIRMRIESGRKVWIAQRNGRTKDGRDATDQGLLKMLGMSGTGDFERDFGQLKITPVSISYQYETCDVQKALELTERMSGTPYRKRPNEDFYSIISGILSPKGDIAIAVCQPIEGEELHAMGAMPRPDAYKALTDAIDRRIIDNYRLHDTNYIAHDILHGSRRFADRYTAAQEQAFRSRLAAAESHFGEAAESADTAKTAREIYLGIYANPIDAKQHA